MSTDMTTKTLATTAAFLLKECSKDDAFAGFQGIPMRVADGMYYKGSNIPILMASMDALGARESLPLFGGFSHWGNFRRKVRKGGKASWGVVVSGVRKLKKGEEAEPDIPMSDNEKEGIGEYDEISIPYFKPIKTFHYSQTEASHDDAPEMRGKEPLETLSEESKKRTIMLADEAIRKQMMDWANRFPKNELEQGEKQFICRFAYALALAHRFGGFQPQERFPEPALAWLEHIMYHNPRRLMRGCNMAYRVLQELNPELKELEEQVKQREENLKEGLQKGAAAAKAQPKEVAQSYLL